MAGVDDMWYYARNSELAPILDAVDAAFEERAGMTRNEALYSEPMGGPWVDEWLAVLQEVGQARVEVYRWLVATATNTLPETYSHDDISETDLQELTERVIRLMDAVSDAVQNWKFVMARMMADKVWAAVKELFPYKSSEAVHFFEMEWAELFAQV